MRPLTRWIAIAVLWLLCAATMRSLKPPGPPRFAEAVPPPPSPNAAPLRVEETINPDQGLPMVHVASLAQSPDGILNAVWYGGTAECHPDVKIYISQREPKAPWTAPQVIMTREQAERDLARPVKALGNALLLAEPDGSLRLLFVTIAMGKWSGSQLNTCVSKDGGLTWSKAVHLTLSPLFNFSELVRNRPVPLRGGGWCVPVYQEFLGKFPELLWVGKDGSWRKSRIAGGCSVFQPSLVPAGDESAVVLLRDYTDARKIHLSRTHDGGREWSPVTPADLPNPDAGISGLRLADGSLLVAYNDSPANRSDLSLALSKDDGASWTRLGSLQREEKATFSYPYLLRQSDGLIALAYTWKSREIRCVTFNGRWLDDRIARTPRPAP